MTYTPGGPPARAHQIKANELAKGKVAFALLMDMGTGKSKTAINEIGQLYDDGIIDRVLIIAGKGSYLDWRDKHIPESIDPTLPISVFTWLGTKLKYLAEFQEFLKGPPILKFFITTYESLGASPKGVTAAHAFVAAGKTAIYVDESSKMKGRKTERTKVLMALAKYSVVRRIMTGTDITQGPMDLWAQFEFLQKGLLGFKNFYSFRARYAILEPLYLGGRKIDKIMGYQRLDELKTTVDKHSFRITKEECTDLPPKIYRSTRVELTEEQADKYAQMRDECLVELGENQWASATLVLGQLRALHRITCGHIRGEDGIVRMLNNNRPQAVLDTIDECTGGVVIWCAYQADVETLYATLTGLYGASAVVKYYGPTSQDDRIEAIRRIQAGEARFFIGTAASGGYGITITTPNNVIYYSNTFSLEHRLQSEDRVYRIGQDKVCTYTDLITPGTLDQHILTTLMAKREVADLVATGEIRAWLAKPI